MEVIDLIRQHAFLTGFIITAIIYFGMVIHDHS